MKIGILGTGDVGQALGIGFATLGHEVKMGSRDPNQEKVKTWVNKAGAKASAGTFAETAAYSELAVLCTIWTGAENAIRLAGPDHLAGKVVIDTINPLDFSGGIPPKLAVGHTDSAGEQVQHGHGHARILERVSELAERDARNRHVGTESIERKDAQREQDLLAQLGNLERVDDRA